MNRTIVAAWTWALVAVVLVPPAIAQTQNKRSRHSDFQLSVALHYDFYAVEANRVLDQAKPKHEGTIRDGQIVQGKRKPAVQLDGHGSILVTATAADLDPTDKALTVGALCQPAAPDGMLITMGGAKNGLSIYLREGIPHFSVRSAGTVTTVAADKPVAMNQWIHLMGTLDSSGELSIVVNGWPRATAQGRLIAGTPELPLSIGEASGVEVNDTQQVPNWTGLLEDIRLYWGVMDRNQHRDQLGDWADLPGCGCRK